MASAPKCVPIRRKPPAAASPLTAEMKEFIDRAIVPALVKQYLSEMDLANSDSDAAHSQRNTAAPKLRTMRP
jgi:hypothetical protein